MTADDMAMKAPGTELKTRDSGFIGGLLHSAPHDDIQDER
jgi:hypothetical protein